jgi:hypothetical protein
MASNLAAGGPASKESASKLSADPMAATCRDADRNPARLADDEVRPSARLVGEVREFCAQEQIENEVHATIHLAREHFAIVGEPVFQVVIDPDCGEHYVGIHVRAEGQTEHVFRQSEAFLDSFLESIDQHKQRYINLIYLPTQE